MHASVTVLLKCNAALACARQSKGHGACEYIPRGMRLILVSETGAMAPHLAIIQALAIDSLASA